MVALRVIAALGIMSSTSIAQATTADDTYIAGYAAVEYYNGHSPSGQF